MRKSEIRESTKIQLIDKVRKHDYGKYLLKASIQKIRGFSGEDITFEFPVTALIGPNGSGKSSVLGSAAIAYKSIKPGIFFPKCAIGDESMSGWIVDFELIDKSKSPRQVLKRKSNFRQAKWVRSEVLEREVLFFGIERTVPAGEKPKYKKLMRSTYQHTGALNILASNISDQVKHILGKPIDEFQVTKIGHTDKFFIGRNGSNQYSEFHFGAGESSIIRMISEIENASANSLILIEEIENGLHPIAAQRMVEYLIDAANRKSIQAIFTTHSDHALAPLPNEAIWACIDGKLRQGKLSIEALRAVSGRVDKKLAIFVEDQFSKCWIDTILREMLGARFEQVEVHAVAGDGNAVATHKSHISNPAISFRSLCVIDGDSLQQEDESDGILRLPGDNPELEVFENVKNKTEDIAVLTVSCHRAPEAQTKVTEAIEEVLCTNRDPHLLYNQLGMKIGFVPESIVRSAFLSLWVRNNRPFCQHVVDKVNQLIEEEV